MASFLTPVVAEQAKALVWFTEQITRLEMELAALKSERDSLKTQMEEVRQHQTEVDLFREENARLTQALAQAEAKLEGLRRLL